MKKIIIGIDEKGNITTNFDGFQGPACFEEAQELASRLKKMGVEVDVQNLQPKKDNKVKDSQSHLIEEG